MPGLGSAVELNPHPSSQVVHRTNLEKATHVVRSFSASPHLPLESSLLLAPIWTTPTQPEKAQGSSSHIGCQCTDPQRSPNHTAPVLSPHDVQRETAEIMRSFRVRVRSLEVFEASHGEGGSSQKNTRTATSTSEGFMFIEQANSSQYANSKKKHDKYVFFKKWVYFSTPQV